MTALTKPVENEEKKAALFAIGSDKSPGSDGMNKQANSTLIDLIPKKKVSASVKDFRSISCCTTFYKTISKILSARIAYVLSQLVGPEQAAFVKGKSGVRQGDPLSPYHFVLSMEILFMYLRNICLKPQDILALFSGWSWLYANVEKTDIYFGGVSPTIKDQILHATGFSEGSFFFRYLGLPLNTARNTADMYGPPINKIQSFVQHWIAKFLSYAGKVGFPTQLLFT
ncbi:uncharacterized protein LOC141588794 [Silene latifolia]|uniref:uncharacterized protein LOC141588794 n=1 Tax=Silene latifolia TaxID=37657 RepID=UPI003D77F4C0